MLTLFVLFPAWFLLDKPAPSQADARTSDEAAATAALVHRTGDMLEGYSNLPKAVRSSPREVNKPKFGPPPPGYYRIVGEPVADWDEADQFASKPRSLAWFPLGPRPITGEYWSGTANASGRCVGVAPHPTNANVVYVASASGGIWKTIDGGTTWLPMSDELSILNHGAIALDPANPDTVYAGTGEYTTGSSGDGLFRSTDGGTTWTRIATTADVGSQCSRIVVDPTNPLVIHVTGSRGYVRSTNGGSTWTLQLSGACSDVAINPSNPQILYVAKHSDGIYQSTNGGGSLTKLTSGLPTSDMNRILVVVAASNPSVLYSVFINGSAGLRGLYQSTDGGANWTQKTNTPDFPSPQGWYDVFIGVDPTNSNTVYCGGVFPSYAVAGVIKTTNGGNSWTDITVRPSGQLHPDQHAIAFGPGGVIWIGNDGGVWKSTNGGNSWVNTNATLTVTQNYNIALHPTDPAQVMGGTQDNGTVQRVIDDEDWPQIVSGDGGFLAFDHADPSRVYTTYVYLTVFRIDNSGFDDITGPWSSDSRNFIAPLVMDPSNSNILVGGTNRVWRTTNASTTASWTAISTTAVAGGGTLNAIAIAKTASNTIYTGSSSGRVYVTTDAATWFSRSNTLPTQPIVDLFIDPTNDAVAYVAYQKPNSKRVLRTIDYGVNWTDVTGTLPANTSPTALEIDWRFDPPHMWVGTGSGVYHSPDDGATWTKDGADLPNVNIGDLVIDYDWETITAGTYGRGAWRRALPPVGVLGDIDGDGDVDGQDLALLLAAFLETPGDPNWNPDADLDGNGIIEAQDLAILLSNWTV